jgi:hypothetical protein
LAWPKAADHSVAAAAPVTIVAITRSFIGFTPLALIMVVYSVLLTWNSNSGAIDRKEDNNGRQVTAKRALRLNIA